MTDNPTYAPSAGRESRPISEQPTNGNGFANAVSQGNVNTGARTSVADPAYGPAEVRTGRRVHDLFVLITFVLSLIGWITTLVGLAYVTAIITKELRIIWFGFVVQTILSVVVLEFITGSGAYDVYAYATQIALLSSLACVFAVIGVDRTIYLHHPALRATGAGCLILAIVDLLWVIYFTSPPQSPVARLFMLAEARNPTTDEPEAYGKVEKIGRSTDAFAMSPIHGGSAQRVMSGVPTMVQPDGTTHSRPKKLWSTESGARRTVTSAASVGGGAANSATPASDVASERPESALPEPQSDPEPQVKAEALFDYAGSADDPNELVFKKGDVLLILDKSGKWWEARTKDGRKGIAPSNYLKQIK